MDIKWRLELVRRSGKPVVALRGETTGSVLYELVSTDEDVRAWLLAAPGRLGEMAREVLRALDEGQAFVERSVMRQTPGEGEGENE